MGKQKYINNEEEYLKGSEDYSINYNAYKKIIPINPFLERKIKETRNYKGELERLRALLRVYRKSLLLPDKQRRRVESSPVTSGRESFEMEEAYRNVRDVISNMLIDTYIAIERKTGEGYQMLRELERLPLERMLDGDSEFLQAVRKGIKDLRKYKR